MSERPLKRIQHHRLEPEFRGLCVRRPPIVVGEEAGRCGSPNAVVVAVTGTVNRDVNLRYPHDCTTAHTATAVLTAVAEAPTKPARASDLGNTVGVTGFEPAASSSRTGDHSALQCC